MNGFHVGKSRRNSNESSLDRIVLNDFTIKYKVNLGLQVYEG